MTNEENLEVLLQDLVSSASEYVMDNQKEPPPILFVLLENGQAKFRDVESKGGGPSVAFLSASIIATIPGVYASGVASAGICEILTPEEIEQKASPMLIKDSEKKFLIVFYKGEAKCVMANPFNKGANGSFLGIYKGEAVWVEDIDGVQHSEEEIPAGEILH